MRLVSSVFASLLVICGLGCRPTSEDRPQRGSSASAATNGSWLQDVTDEIGLDFIHEAGASGELHMPEIMCGGLAVFDCDRDGRLDLYFVNGHRGLPDPTPCPGTPNRLYRQMPDGTFEDITDGSGLDDNGYGMGVAIGDVDNDGFVDVYVTNYGADALYRNRGDGTFENITRQAGIDVGGWSSSATFLDFDRDGNLDLYIARYLEYNPLADCYDAAGRETYCGPASFPGVTDVLLHNLGDGKFEDVSQRKGIAALRGAGLGVIAADFNADGWTDLYVANDGDPNFLWINNGTATPQFSESALAMGAAFNVNGKAEASMGIVAPDLDNDGDFDLFMTHLDGETNTAYLNLGGRMGFMDLTAETGLDRDSLRLTGFGVVAFDLELDGDVDIAAVNGRVIHGKQTESKSGPEFWQAFEEPKLIYENDGNGRFHNIAHRAAEFVTATEVSRGLAAADLDRDGDLDLVIVNAGARARVFRNEAPRAGDWLVVRAWDPRYRRDALGAVVQAAFGESTQSRNICANESYLTAIEPEAAFGIPKDSDPGDVTVVWPDGKTEVFTDVTPNQHITLQRGGGKIPEELGQQVSR